MAAERRFNRVARPCAKEHRYGPSNHSDDSFAQSVGESRRENSLPAPINSPHFLGASSRSDLDARLTAISRLVGSDLRAWHRSWTDYEPLGSNPLGRRFLHGATSRILLSWAILFDAATPAFRIRARCEE